MAFPMHYETSYQWSGGDDAGTLAIEGRAPLPVGGPMQADRYSPEHMLLGATEVCLLNTFVAIAGMSRLEIKEYRSAAEGELTFEKGRGYKFEKITIRPTVTVAEKDLDKAKRVLERSHSACLVSRSLNCPVDVEPEFKTV